MSASGELSAAELADERRHLFALAYRMFGSTGDAEAAVRQTYGLWYALSDSERRGITEPRAWLTNTAGRLCLTALASARPVREEYPGEWLPEPVPGAVLGGLRPGGAGPAGRVDASRLPGPAVAAMSDRLSLDESITMGLLVTLDSLTPAERVAFVLHDVFGLPFGAVGAVVGRTPASTRTLAKTARRRIHDRSARESAADPDVHSQAVHRLRLAAETGEPIILGRVLAPDVQMLTDAGDNDAVDARTVTGATDVAAKVVAVLARDPTELTEREVNGQIGLVLRRGGRVMGIVSVNVQGGLVTDLWIVLNPDKLRHWNE